jgi:methylthioribose-1-phosphate isomerase
MIVGGKHYRSIWPDPADPAIIRIINQHKLPFEFRIDGITSSQETLDAIRSMKIRGAPLIGVAGAFGLSFACMESAGRKDWKQAVLGRANLIRSARPTAGTWHGR